MNVNFIRPSIREHLFPTDRPMPHPLLYPTFVNDWSAGHDIPTAVTSDIVSTIPTANGSIRQHDHHSTIGDPVSSVHAANKKGFFRITTIIRRW